MAGKMKFKPEVTRVRLNPEQAVLECFCYNTGRAQTLRTCSGKSTTTCEAEAKGTVTGFYTASAVSS